MKIVLVLFAFLWVCLFQQIQVEENLILRCVNGLNIIQKSETVYKCDIEVVNKQSIYNIFGTLLQRLSFNGKNMYINFNRTLLHADKLSSRLGCTKGFFFKFQHLKNFLQIISSSNEILELFLEISNKTGQNIVTQDKVLIKQLIDEIKESFQFLNIEIFRKGNFKVDCNVVIYL